MGIIDGNTEKKLKEPQEELGSTNETMNGEIGKLRNHTQRINLGGCIIDLAQPPEVIGARKGGSQNFFKSLGAQEMESTCETEGKCKKRMKLTWAQILLWKLKRFRARRNI